MQVEQENSMAPQSLFTGCRVLIAEDNPVNQQLAQRMLVKLGCRADVAANGHEAVLLHGVQPYDLLLMDCQMPKVDGYEATARIRSSEGAARRTPIIALTARADPGEREACLTAGMDDFISKPIRPAVLREVLDRWLRHSAEAKRPGVLKTDDLEAVHAMFGNDFGELAALFQADSRERIAILQQAAAAGDNEQVAKIAHVFSGSCASIGAPYLSALGKGLELRAKAGELKEYEKELAAIDEEYSRIIAKLQRMTARVA